MTQAYIVDAVRTAGGRRKGALRDWHPADLGGEVLNALVARTGIDPAAIDDVIVGCVTQAGEQAFAFARNIVLASSLPDHIPAVTIDRQCGSSLQALHFAAQAVMSGTQDMVIAAGVEHMTRVPMFSNMTLHERDGIGTGPFSQRIRERFGVQGFSQFDGAEMLATKHGLDRPTLDAFALHSHQKAAAATQQGRFANEIVPIGVTDGWHDRDEGIRYDANQSAIAAMAPLQDGGTITAANASQMCDGAAAVLVVNEAALRAHGLVPMARIVQLTVTAGDPVIMLEEPINATRRALLKAGLALGDIDRFEVNEAFASVPLAWLKALDADPARLNVNGGAIALGHPLGATGCKLTATLVHELRASQSRYGLIAICEGGGTANVTIVEAL